jgi:hypothetical protein
MHKKCFFLYELGSYRIICNCPAVTDQFPLIVKLTSL